MSESQPEIDVPIPPPLLFLGFFLVGVAIGYFIPIPFLSNIVSLPLGIVVAAVGFYLSVQCFREFRRAKTPPDFRPVTALVSAGPYRYTRNPIYISFSTIYLGFGIAFNSGVTLLLLLLVIAIVDRVIIRREERYLEQKLGEEYLQYKARVRRWI